MSQVPPLNQRPSIPLVIYGGKKKKKATKEKFNWASEAAGGHLLRVGSN